MRFVHCMTRVPGKAGALVYPHELDLPDPYYGQSTLALLGSDYEDLAGGYMFLAMLEGKILPVWLERIGTGMGFLAAINGVGKFVFRAMPLVPAPYYAGSHELAEPRRAPYYLSTADHPALDAAAREQDFYFAGFSPVLGAAADYPFGETPLI